jgi:hypothetical protein
VRDDDGVVSPRLSRSVTVRLGAPIVDSVGIDTSASGVFVRDSRRYRVAVRDSNGVVLKVYANWQGGVSPQDSEVVNPPSGRVTAEFTHSYDTAQAGAHDAKFWVIDDDRVVSPALSKNVVVRKAPPVVRGDSKDTLWVVVDKGAGYNYTLHVRSEDTNGVIVRYYWDERVAFDSTTLPPERKTSDSLFSRTIGSVEVNQGWPIWIYARDDDNLVRGGRFTVYADGPPPRCEPVFPADESAVSGIVQFKWKRFDAHDKSDTEFRVMYYKGTAQPVAVNGMDFTKGISLNYTAADSSFSTAATGLPSGTLNWFVVAKDERGLQTVSDTLWFDHN